ncbi:helix-turn-helix domain-containing protein [Halomonas campisalis]|uniref:Helix-turn-helix domain-containing protein n=2 Tax=Billgrantia campisalis TaxID=74661 RepID=A0ABS9PDJ2_9GAMM|nr:helix-turn-helix domain-containing protein [Halomonas campisalis]
MYHTGAPLQGADLMTAVIDRRRALGLTQSEFAKRLGISLRTYQEWEQGRRRPSGPAESMLRRAL